MQAINAVGKIGKIPVGGTDGTHDALVSMDKGEPNNTVYQDPVAQGEEAVNAAYLIAKHEPNPKVVDGNIWIPYQKITKENYKSFICDVQRRPFVARLGTLDHGCAMLIDSKDLPNHLLAFPFSLNRHLVVP